MLTSSLFVQSLSLGSTLLLGALLLGVEVLGHSGAGVRLVGSELGVDTALLDGLDAELLLLLGVLFGGQSDDGCYFRG